MRVKRFPGIGAGLAQVEIDIAVQAAEICIMQDDNTRIALHVLEHIRVKFRVTHFVDDRIVSIAQVREVAMRKHIEAVPRLQFRNFAIEEHIDFEIPRKLREECGAVVRDSAARRRQGREYRHTLFGRSLAHHRAKAPLLGTM